MKCFIVALLLASLCLAVEPQPWVDTSQVQGTLLFSGLDVNVNRGVRTWGTVRDPEGRPISITLAGLPTDVHLDPNTGDWFWEWRPDANDIGTHYAVVTFRGGEFDETVTTTPIRVLPPSQPPVVTPGGCAVIK